MKASIDTVKIEMSYIDAQELKHQISSMIADITTITKETAIYFDDVHIRETYPKVNELLSILNTSQELPF
jgi:hypothetical protein